MIVHDKERENTAFNDLIMKFEKNPKPVLAVEIGEEE